MSQTPSLPSPDKWTDEMTFFFLSVALRHVEVVGNLHTQDIRDGLAFVANKYAKAEAPQTERQASEAERAAITEAVGFEFQPSEMQTVSADDLLRVYRAGLKDMPHWRRAIYNAEECLNGCLATNAFDGKANIETAQRIVLGLQSSRFQMLDLEGAQLAPAHAVVNIAQPDDGTGILRVIRYGSSVSHGYTPSPSAEQVDQDGWIMWAGGDCPVPLESEVIYRMKSDPRKLHVDLADSLDWNHHDGIVGRSNIIAYKLKAPTKP